MKAIEAGFVGLRFLGLWFLLAGLFGLSGTLSWIGFGDSANPETRWVGIGLLVAHLAIMALAGYVFVNARKVSRFLFGSADDLESSPSSSLQAVGFSVIGAVFVLGALPGLVTELARFVWVLRAGAVTEREAFISSTTFFDVLYNVLSLAFGAFVFARSTWLARRWTGFQEPSDEARLGSDPAE